MTESARQQLRSGIADLGIHIETSAEDALLAFLDLLARWNRRIRLVGNAERADAVDIILVDSLSVLLAIPENARTIVDIGSGAGLPGLVIAIARPKLRITTVEPIHKKHAFQRTAIRELELANVDARPIRMEQLDPAETFDVAVSRATFALPTWLTSGRSCVKPDGVVVGLANQPSDIPATAEAIPYQISGRTRYLVVKK